jgi:hypothetical protein
MYFDLSRSEMENVLTGFLVGALGVELKAQVSQMELPEDYRTRICKAESEGRPWTAWSTDRGLVAAWGEQDLDASRKLHACVLFVSWCGEAFSQHGIWCYCYPNRPTEWIVGRERVE